MAPTTTCKLIKNKTKLWNLLSYFFLTFLSNYILNISIWLSILVLSLLRISKLNSLSFPEYLPWITSKKSPLPFISPTSSRGATPHRSTNHPVVELLFPVLVSYYQKFSNLNTRTHTHTPNYRFTILEVRSQPWSYLVKSSCQKGCFCFSRGGGRIHFPPTWDSRGQSHSLVHGAFLFSF